MHCSDTLNVEYVLILDFVIGDSLMQLQSGYHYQETGLVTNYDLISLQFNLIFI